MVERDAAFTTHLPPSCFFRLLADPEAALAPAQRKHVEECATCKENMLRVLGAVAPHPSARQLLARVERHRERGEFPRAFELLTSVVLLDGRPEVGQLCALASARLHREMGYFEIAVEQFRALLRSPGLGPAPRIACLNNLAWFERQNDDLDSAQALLRQAESLAAGEAALAVRKEHAETRHQQAVVLMIRRQLDGAAALIAEALRIREELDGPERLDVARSLLIQGAIRSHQGDPAGGVELLRQALAIRVAALGPYHADVADILCRIGDMYKMQGLDGEAKRTYDDAIASFKGLTSTLLGTIGLARCHARLAEIYPELNQPGQAADFASKALAVLALRESDRLAYESALRHVAVVTN
jgi:tetratricopeptide (TPR) repeat protein